MKKLVKYLILDRKLKKLCNMNVTVVPVVVGPLEMMPKRFERWWKNWISMIHKKTIKMYAEDKKQYLTI